MQQTVLITGGTGLIGQAVSTLLAQNGYKVIHLSRTENLKAIFPAYHWDIEKQTIDKKALAQADFIIHLAGEGIADKRWSAARKQQIINSRVKSTQLLSKFLSDMDKKPLLFIGASAIGYYGNTADAVLDENSPSGTGFLSESCMKWEQSYQTIKNLNIPCPIVRVGVVLTTKGGALSKMLPSYKLRLGAYFANGSQMFSWIHIDDVARAFLFILTQGTNNLIYNATAPEPISNYELAKTIASVYQKKCLVAPVPAFALRAIMGEMADVVLHGSKVMPAQLQNAGFEFSYPTIHAALSELLIK
jgi:uncharacterized protein